MMIINCLNCEMRKTWFNLFEIGNDNYVLYFIIKINKV